MYSQAQYSVLRNPWLMIISSGIISPQQSGLPYFFLSSCSANCSGLSCWKEASGVSSITTISPRLSSPGVFEHIELTWGFGETRRAASQSRQMGNGYVTPAV